MSFIRKVMEKRKQKPGLPESFYEEVQRQADKKGVLVRESEAYPQRYARRRMLEHELRPYCAIQRKCEFFDQCYDRNLGVYNWDVLERCADPIIKAKLLDWQKKELVFEQQEEEEG